ncbi:hypothetical protein PENTCL1PPCAC_16122, partial [Pristionchus entomophagus]
MQILLQEAWVCVTSLHAPTFMACFIDRQQAVLPPGSIWILSQTAQFLIEFSLVVLAIGMTLLLEVLFFEYYLQSILLQILESKWHTANAQSPSCFDRGKFVFFMLACVFGMMCGVVLACAISIHTFSQLKFSTSLSEKKRNFNRMMSRVLIIQSVVPLGLVLIPLSIALGLILPFSTGPQYVSVPISICFLIISTHSVVHSIVLLTMTPIYRRKAVDLFRR